MMSAFSDIALRCQWNHPDNFLASLLEPESNWWAQPFCTFFPAVLINSSWICGNPEDFLQGSNLLEHKISCKHPEFLTAVSLSHLFVKPGIKEKSFVLYVFLPYTTLLSHSYPENFCFLSMLLSCTLHLLGFSKCKYRFYMNGKSMYFCEKAFVLLLLLPEPTNDCTDFLTSLWRDKGSILLCVSALILTVVLKFRFLFRGLSPAFWDSKCSNSKHCRSRERKRWTGRKISWSKTCYTEGSKLGFRSGGPYPAAQQKYLF